MRPCTWLRSAVRTPLLSLARVLQYVHRDNTEHKFNHNNEGRSSPPPPPPTMRFSLLALALVLADVAAAPTSRPPPRQSVSLSLFGRPKIGPRRTASSTSSSNSTNTSAAASSSAPPPSKPSGPPAPLPPLQKYICQLVNDLPRPANDGKLYVRPPGGENMSGRELALGGAKRY